LPDQYKSISSENWAPLLRFSLEPYPNQKEKKRKKESQLLLLLFLLLLIGWGWLLPQKEGGYRRNIFLDRRRISSAMICRDLPFIPLNLNMRIWFKKKLKGQERVKQGAICDLNFKKLPAHILIWAYLG